MADQSLKNYPFDGRARFPALVGDTIDVTPNLTFGTTVTPTILRKPGGSSASFSGNTFTADVSGLYRLRVSWSSGQVVRDLDVVVWPSSITNTVIAPPAVKIDRPLLARLLANPGISDEGIFAALEAGSGPAFFTGFSYVNYLPS